MTAARRAPESEERRKLFRRMEWVYVWAPPLLIVLVGGSTALLVAWALPVYGLGFWTRWLIAFALIIGLPFTAWLIHGRLRR